MRKYFINIVISTLIVLAAYLAGRDWAQGMDGFFTIYLIFISANQLDIMRILEKND